MLKIERWISDPAASNHLTSHASVVRSAASEIFYQQSLVEKNSKKRPTVAIFGPSQSGKSYLTAKICENSDETVRIKIDKDYDFLRDINPAGGRESTALITRLTTSPYEEGKEKQDKVYASLLSLADLIAIFVNIYVNDLKHSSDISRETISKCIEDVCGLGVLDEIHKAKSWIDPELIYLKQLLGYLPYDLRPYTDLLRLPKGSLADKNSKSLVQLFSLMWGDIKELNDLFEHLCDYLLQLNRMSYILIPVDAFVPREQSIIDVTVLSDLQKEENYSSQLVLISTSDGEFLELPRPVLCALISEVQFVLNSPKSELLNYVDFLDFPGARSRIRRNIDLYQEAGIEKLYLRGKISHLFESAASRDEIDTLLLCVKPGPMDIASLPDTINRWIDGVAKNQIDTRFFILATQFDLHFPDAAGQAKQEKDRFDNAIFSAIIEPFAPTEDSWIQKLDFKNVIPIRNPNYPYDGFFVYEENGKETAIRHEKLGRINELKKAFTESTSAKHFISNGADKWQSLMTPGDGGVLYLMHDLAQIDWKNLKTKRMEEGQRNLLKQVFSLLEPFALYDDVSKKIDQEKEKFAKNFVQLEKLVRSENLASFVELFSVSSLDLKASVSSDILSGSEEQKTTLRVNGVRVPSFLKGTVSEDIKDSVKTPREKFLRQVVAALLVSLLEELENNIKNCPKILSPYNESIVYLNSQFTSVYQLEKLRTKFTNLEVGWDSGLKLTDNLEPLCMIASRVFDSHIFGAQVMRNGGYECITPNPVTNTLSVEDHSSGNIEFFNNWMDHLGMMIEENASNASGNGRDLTLNEELLKILSDINSRVDGPIA
jgi:hypothetical protein